MKAGETERFDCEHCNTEFEVTYEPKATNTKDAAGFKPRDVVACPFCGEQPISQE